MIAELQMSECAGDLKSKFSGKEFLACFGPDAALAYKAYFTMARVAPDHVHKSLSLIPRHDPMPVISGYLLQYQLGDGNPTTYPLALRRNE